MSSSIVHRIHERTFLELILHDDLRAELLRYLAGPGATVQGFAELVDVVAPKCEAPSDRLREAVRLLEAEPDPIADRILVALLHHPAIPDDVLMRLAAAGTHLAILGHRGGPRALLELLAERHRYPEAITTLALHYLGAAGTKARPFHLFVERYRDVEMLEYNLTRATSLDPAKREIVREIFGYLEGPP